MRILVLANNLSGLMSFRKEVMHAMVEQGYEVYISVPYDKRFDAQVSEMGVKIIDTEIDRRGINPITDLKLIKRYNKMVKEVKPDVVLSYTIKPNLYGGLACKWAKVPQLVNITGLGTAVENPGMLQKFVIGLYKCCFKNGSIIADNTSVIGYKQDIFDNVNISGRWNVEYISTDMFKDLTAVNSLKNVFALTSNKVNNVLIVEKGNYRVSADNKNLNILSVPSNTEVILNGVVTLEPNDLTNYYIVDLKGENIKLHGNGQIIGDKQTHTGTRGEWGMGVMLRECSNVDIYDLTIKDCWGDCIYIGDNTSGVRINNCTLDHGRRQGISITSATNVTIANCIITNVGGTAPEYAIDIEPNKNETVDSVFIKNVKSENCKGGILSGSGAANSCTRNIFVSDCYVEKFEKRSYCFSNTDNVKLVNNVSDKGNKPNFYNCTSVSVE